MNSIDAVSERWCEEGYEYVAGINEYVRKGMTLGWDKVGEPPEDTRSGLAEQVIEFVRQANETGDIKNLRQKFPPDHAPLLDLIEENGQHISPIVLLDDGRILIRVHASYQESKVYIIDGLNIEPLDNIISVGQSPNRKYFAVAKELGVEIYEGWEGRQVAWLNWPTGLEGVPSGFNVEPLKGIPTITHLSPFPDGTRVLLVSSEGIFVLSPDNSIRLHPSTKYIREYFTRRRRRNLTSFVPKRFERFFSRYIEWSCRKQPIDPLNLNIDMEHGTISPDGKFIAVGSQDSNHLIFNENYELVGDVGPMSSYPHYTVFSEDSEFLACNSCHFYNGITIGVPLSLLPGLKTEPYELDNRLVELDDYARVYAAVSRQDEFIFGDAYGYLRAVDKSGNFRWQHFIGSSIGDMDISRDGKTLIASTYAGFLSIIKLDTGKADPYTIGTATHQEIRRWLFWKKEKKPLVW